MKNEAEKIKEARLSGLRPEAVGCFVSGGQLLFLYKKAHDIWQLPQGGIEKGETIQAALKREMAEELGEEFLAGAEFGEIFAEAQVIFREAAMEDRTIKTDDGQEILMQGKKYFFVKVKSGSRALDISKTEFDDSRWEDYSGALVLAEGIYQNGKKRITLKAINELKSRGWL